MGPLERFDTARCNGHDEILSSSIQGTTVRMPTAIGHQGRTTWPAAPRHPAPIDNTTAGTAPARKDSWQILAALAHVGAPR